MTLATSCIAPERRPLAAAKDGLHLGDNSKTTSKDAGELIADAKAESAEVVDAARQWAKNFAEEQKRVGADQAHTLATAVPWRKNQGSNGRGL
jgi:hypothetical protein